MCVCVCACTFQIRRDCHLMASAPLSSCRGGSIPGSVVYWSCTLESRGSLAVRAGGSRAQRAHQHLCSAWKESAQAVPTGRSGRRHAAIGIPHQNELQLYLKPSNYSEQIEEMQCSSFTAGLSASSHTRHLCAKQNLTLRNYLTLAISSANGVLYSLHIRFVVFVSPMKRVYAVDGLGKK